MISKMVQVLAVLAVVLGLTLVDVPVVGAIPSATPAKVPIKVTGIDGTLELHSTITVTVENLRKYLEKPCKDPKKFVLYLNWRPIKGVHPKLVGGQDQLQFDIRRTADSKEEWNALLGRPSSLSREVTVSVGYEKENPVESAIKPELVIVNKSWLRGFAIFFLIILIALGYLAKTTAIIRDPGSGQQVRERPYSLGRTQMAFWFFLVAVSYVFIWMITGDLESLTGSIVALTGISAGTALGSVAVEAIKQNKAKNKLRGLEHERAVLKKGLGKLDSQLTEKPTDPKASDWNKEKAEKETRLEEVAQEINALKVKTPPSTSKGFFRDILSDAEGVSVHRFQIFVWTIILGVIFVVSIYRNLAIPQFSETLLALMGISSGTYIGFKFPEKKA